MAIHPPTDSSLLLDAVRLLDRLLRRSEREAGFTAYHRHLRRAKRRAMETPHLAPRALARWRACYRELVRFTEATASYATCALGPARGAAVDAHARSSAHAAHHAPAAGRAGDRPDAAARLPRRPVPADEKLVSFFEARADILVKDRRAMY
ncbi:MAG: hypothetical protein Q8K82_09185 [Gemmatimonadaceae bacterium]|nr:hypothetical protein [Gemmatimonadaceae bacterium]